MFEAMLQGEMDNHLGYKANDHGSKDTDNRRNCYTDKSLKTSYGEVPIRSPRDRDSSFEPQIVPKRTTDVSSIEDKVLSMYAILFVDCLYVYIRRETETKSCAVYVILGYDFDGRKDILGMWIGEAEGKHYWMQIFDEIKNRGVEDVIFICMDGVSGLEDGARSIFKDAVIQRCIVHMIRNSIKYVPSKDYKRFTAQLKKVPPVHLQLDIAYLYQDW